MNSSFLYILDNLNLHGETTIVFAMSTMVLGVSFLFFLYTVSLYLSGWLLLIRDAREIANKKNTLNDLILMRDIQTEMEKEIEQASLKATFQS